MTADRLREEDSVVVRIPRLDIVRRVADIMVLQEPLWAASVPFYVRETGIGLRGATPAPPARWWYEPENDEYVVQQWPPEEER